MYIYIIIYLIYIFYKSRTSLYMLQQNLYNENNRYLKWILRNPKKSYNTVDFIPFLLLIFVLLSKDSFIMETCYLTIMTVYLLGIYEEYKKNQLNQNKISFKVTNRIKRLYMTEFIIILGLLTFLVYTNFNGIVLLVLTLLMAFNYYYIYVVNLINKPLEKLVYFYYFQKAKNKLKDMSRLEVVGITGSYGKTTSKNIVNHILSSAYITRPTPKNLNTPYGLMITINNYLDKFDEFFIAEMGAYVSGEIKNMCSFVKPRYGILTTIGEAHLETFKTKENICQAKFELIESLKPNGVAVLNLDDSYQVNYVENNLKNKVKILWIGVDNKEAMFNATNIKMDKNGMNFDVYYQEEKYHFQTKLLGIHNIYNILAGVALGFFLKINPNDMIAKVKTLTPVEHRLEIKKLNQITMIDDAYNSNPVGARNAVSVLGMMDGIKVVVTPGMIELGSLEDKLNYELGTSIAKHADYVILIGKEKTKSIKKALIDSGFKEDNIIILNKVVDSYLELDKIKSRYSDREVYALFENDLPDIYSEGEIK